MIRKSIKWIAILGVVAVIALTLLGKKTFHVEAVIPAPPAAVWEVLMDTARYPEWNPVFVSVGGPYEQGGRILNEVRDPKGEILEMTATVAELIPERKLRQKGGVTGFITFDHQCLLEPVDGGTRVIQHEVDRGLYLWFWDSSWIEPAYGRTNEVLKARVMSLGGR